MVEINFHAVSVKALGPESQSLLSDMLNDQKVLLAEEGFPRDYRGLGDCMGIETRKWFPDGNFVQHLLDVWVKRKPEDANLGNLREFFERIGRYDVLDDTHELFIKDAQDFLHQEKENASSSSFDPTKEILTIDDFERHRKGLPLCNYDAFLLYVRDDAKFAEELLTTLEGPKYNLRLCEKDRDFLGTIEIERSAIIKIISERCRKLLVILSPEFLQSEEHTYFVQLTQALSFGQKNTSRVVPCVYKECQLSIEFRAFHTLDFRRANGLIDVWEKLYASIAPLGQQCDTRLKVPSPEKCFNLPSPIIIPPKSSKKENMSESENPKTAPEPSISSVCKQNEQNILRERSGSKSGHAFFRFLWKKKNRIKAVAVEAH